VKKVYWWILGLLLSPLLLVALLAAMLYLPPVQNWAVGRVAGIVSEKTGMQISVGHVRLSFPLDLAIDDFLMIHESDTIAGVEHMIADVQLWPLLHSQIIINALEVSNTRLNTNGFIDAAQVKGDFKRLALKSRGIDLDKQTARVNGARLEDARLDIQLRDSVPEDTTTTPTLWRIFADSVTITRSDVALHTVSDSMTVRAHMGSLVAREALVDLASETYTVASADWTGGALAYDQNFEPRVEGLDYNHLDLSHINIGIDSIYYHDLTLRLVMRQVALKEKSGLQVTQLTGPLAMENGSIRLPRFRLLTPSSDVYLEMDMPLSLADSVSPRQMKLKMDAQVGREDILAVIGPSLPEGMVDRWPYFPVGVKGVLNGNLSTLSFSDLDVSLPTAFAARADGFVANLNDMKRLRADVQFKAQTENLGFIMASLPRDMQRDYCVPPLRVEGRVKADGPQYVADVDVREADGTVRLEGMLNADAMRYDVHVMVNNLNVHHFMPRDSIYNVTADLTAEGQGTDIFSPRTTLTANGQIDHLGYGSWNLDNMLIDAQVRNGRGHANINSNNQLLKGVVAVDALMSRQRLDGTITADVSEVDLYRMQLVERPLSIGLCGHVDIGSDLKKTHTVSGLLNDLTLRDSLKVYRPADIGLLVKTRQDTTYVRAQSGDFIVKLDASGDYERLLRSLSVLSDSISRQTGRKQIDQAVLRTLLPPVKLHVESKSENPFVTFLKTSQQTDFKELLFDVTSSPVTGLNGEGHVHALTVDDMRLDTINFRITQRRDHLSFGGQVRNNKKNPQFVFNSLFDGILQERGATFGLRFYDGDDKLGVRLGAKAEMVDSGLNLHLIPSRPTIGYKEFALNADNFVFIDHKNRLQAKIDLIADDGTGLKVYSESNDPTAQQDVTVSVNKLDLGELSAVFPYALPRMTGLLNGDYHVVQDAEGHFSMVSDMAVQRMTYEGSLLGNLSTELMYLQKEGDATHPSAEAHVVEARVMRDSKEIGLLTGTYYNEGDGVLDARLLLKRMPLSLVNGFVPDHLFGLFGYSEGELTVRGKLSEPDIDGEVYLDSCYIESVPYGMTLRFDNDPVRVVDSKLLLDNFTVYALNDNPLNIQGSVDFSQLDNVMVNVRMRARDFQIIGAKENPQSIAYGKAFVNVFASMRGPADNLKMRGRLEVLGSTDMSYVLRDTPLSTDNQLKELVKFTDFGDTATVVVERPELNGFQMDMTVEVSKGAHVMAYLNADHTNYIDLMGGGSLRMQYTPADNLQLRGRYTLSNGEMKYSLPVIPLKTFTIQDGSYIEFTGDPMNPTLNITATERTRAVAADASGGGRSVAFDCGVKITKTLNDMGLEFTLDAPEDMQLHSELQTMGAEQRGKLAVTMLTTGMYLADGNTGAFSMNSALSSFLSSEISSITGNALRTLDLSFGMDNTADASGSIHTDYSFKFAKRFMNNRLKVSVGGLVSTGGDMEHRNSSFFDNVSLEYRLDQTANKFVTLFYQNNVYDWLDGYTQKYGGGFTWRRSLQTFWDIFRFKEQRPTRPMRTLSPGSDNPSSPAGTTVPTGTNSSAIAADSIKATPDEKK